MASVVLEASEEVISPPGEGLYEIIDGKPVEKKIGTYEIHVTNLIGFFLGRFVFDRQLGLVESEMLFEFGQGNQRQRRPDVAFISYQRWSKGRKIPRDNAFSVVPDLVVEVVSPSNSANEVEDKIVEYIKAGVRLVWIVYPTTARIYIHDGSSTVRVVCRDGELDGGDVLPEFRLALGGLFEVDDDNA